MTTTAPTPVDVPISVTPIGPPTSGPQSVPPGPGTTGRIPTVPTPIGPPEDAPPPVSPGVGTGQSSGTTTTVTLPVSEAPVTETTSGTGTNVPAATPIYVKVLADGTVITENTRALNFIGAGISITGNSAQADITIVGGGNGSPGGSNTQIQFNSGGLFGGNTNLTFNSATQALRVGGTVSATGNITGSYFIGNGSQLTGVAANYGNSNVATLLADFGSNAVLTTGNVTGGNLNTGGVVSSTGNVRGANLNTGGVVSATGNITGNYFIGNGSQLTGLGNASTLSSRSNVTVYSGSIANAAAANVTAVGFKGYALYGITTTANAWVTLYTSTAARTADSGRLITTDPTPGTGVVGEVITANTSTQFFTPAVYGFSTETSPDANIQLKISNQSGSTANIGVTLTLLKLEN